jgi:hypothetical protein
LTDPYIEGIVSLERHSSTKPRTGTASSCYSGAMSSLKFFTESQVLSLLSRANSCSLYSVTFVKRTTGQVRKMVVNPKYVPESKGMFPYDRKEKKLNYAFAFEGRKSGNKQFPIDSVIAFKIKGKVITPDTMTE